MSLLRLYIDEDARTGAVIRTLRERKADIITCADVGRLGDEDEEHLLYATGVGRALYSYNQGDYCKIHNTYMEEERVHRGIIIGKQRYSVGEEARRLFKLLTDLSAEDMQNRLEFLSNWN